MSQPAAAEIKKIREETSAPVMDIRAALEEASGDSAKAKVILKKKGLEKAQKKSGRETSQGLIETYVHAGGKVGAMVYLACETDFVARTDEFKKLAKEIAMQVAAMDPKNSDELLDQEYIREPEKKIRELIAEVVSKTGENIQLQKITRFSLNE